MSSRNTRLPLRYKPTRRNRPASTVPSACTSTSRSPTSPIATAGYYQYVEHKNTWFTAADFAANAQYDATFVRLAGVRLVIWQIPLGNTLMRAENNTWDHYQDNRVQWFLGTSWREHLAPLLKAGVVALLFGRGADGNTCACNAAKDGVTNPAPINGNAGVSTSADDDGGYFMSRIANFYKAGGLALPAG